MVATHEVIQSVPQAMALLAQMAGGGSVRIEPCVNPGPRDSTLMCRYVDPKMGCAERAVGGLLAGSQGVECPIQRGVLRIVKSNGTVNVGK